MQQMEEAGHVDTEQLENGPVGNFLKWATLVNLNDLEQVDAAFKVV